MFPVPGFFFSRDTLISSNFWGNFNASSDSFSCDAWQTLWLFQNQQLHPNSAPEQNWIDFMFTRRRTISYAITSLNLRTLLDVTRVCRHTVCVEELTTKSGHLQSSLAHYKYYHEKIHFWISFCIMNSAFASGPKTIVSTMPSKYSAGHPIFCERANNHKSKIIL